MADEAKHTTSDEDLEALYSAAVQLICKGKSPLEWSDDEATAMRLVTQVGTLYHGRPHESAVAAMKRAWAQFGRASWRERRAHCVDVIAEWGAKWKQPEWQASPETRSLLLGQCIDALVLWEPDLGWLSNDPEALAEGLASYDSSPRGKAGAKSASGILADLIADADVTADRDGLGFEKHEGEDLDDYRERVRRQVDKDRRECGW